MLFSPREYFRLAKGILLHTNPIYVQFYVTARCNLTCQQCNIIYANSDVRECTLYEIERIAENLSKLGVVIVLLTGGEPFLRKDLPEIVRAFVRNGIHVRMQTNGFASEEALCRCVEYGARDISISLDSLVPVLQDSINGGFNDSWKRAIKTISMVTRILPKESSFAAFGCVLSPFNIIDVAEVVRFGTEIGWYTSLVPIHVTDPGKPMNFRTYDHNMRFRPEQYAQVDSMLEHLAELKRAGFLLYDSAEYLDDIKRFIRNEPITWRRKKGDLCDSPELYFAIPPNGEFEVCCDHRLPGQKLFTYSNDFPERFRDRIFRERVRSVTSQCSGCMYGSYPEITISARYWTGIVDRMRTFLARPAEKNWPYSENELEEIARSILESRKTLAMQVP